MSRKIKMTMHKPVQAQTEVEGEVALATEVSTCRVEMYAEGRKNKWKEVTLCMTEMGEGDEQGECYLAKFDMKSVKRLHRELGQLLKAIGK